MSAADLTMLVVLAFVLARNIVKLIVERRRGLPFARFRAKLVLAMLGLTIVPSVLVLIVGSRVVMTSVDRWFNAPMKKSLPAPTASPRISTRNGSAWLPTKPPARWPRRLRRSIWRHRTGPACRTW